MSFRKDQKGFSLIEMVIAVGIIAVLAGVSLNLFGRIRSANVEKTVQDLSSQFKKLQVSSMSRTNKPYLYLYKVGDAYYYLISEDGDLPLASLTANKGVKIGNGITISTKESDTDVNSEITTTSFRKIYFQRNGALGSDVDVKYIVISSTNTTARQIKFNSETGKHVTGFAE